MSVSPQARVRLPTAHAAPPRIGFWQAGFEGADHVNGSAVPLCMNTLTAHLHHASEDYRRLAELGIRTVRESAGWRVIDRGNGYDFTKVGHRARLAHEAGIQVLWTFFHYGVPRGVDLFAASFVDRFASYCGALARYLEPFHQDDAVPVYTPINEISFLCWAVCETELLHPHRGDRAGERYELKKQLVRAAIAGTDAIRDADPRARILSVDPLVHVAPDEHGLEEAAARENHRQFEAWDMLSGRTEPQLGGSGRHLDLMGVNYFPAGQWEVRSRQVLAWPHDERRRPLSELLVELHRRYRRPISISETGHVGEHRSAWLEATTQEVQRAREQGVPVHGLCLYPALDRPDWEQPQRWHQSGLLHVHPVSLQRRLDDPYASALTRAQALLAAP